MSVEPSVAARIVEENHAFYAFLKREFGLKQADACLRVFGRDAEKKLEAALADPSKFGMAKSLFKRGRESGLRHGGAQEEPMTPLPHRSTSSSASSSFRGHPHAACRGIIDGAKPVA